MSISSPDKDFFATINKPYQVKGTALDRILNVGNNTRLDLIEGAIYDASAATYKSVGILVYENSNDGQNDPTTFVIVGDVTPAIAEFVGGTAYINGRRFSVPSAILNVVNGSTNYIYINNSGKYVSSTSRPVTLHIPIAVIGYASGFLRNPTNDPTDGWYADSWYAHVWGNGYVGNGMFSGQSLAYKGFGHASNYTTYIIDVADVNLGITGYGTITAKNDFSVAGSLNVTGSLDIVGDLTVTGDFTQVDVGTADKFVMGTFDQILMGKGSGSETAPLGDWGFQFVDHAATPDSVAANKVGVLGLDVTNTRLIITSTTDLRTSSNPSFRGFLNVANLSATVNPDIIIPAGNVTGGTNNNKYLQINYRGLTSGSSNSDGTYGLRINNLNASLPLGIVSSDAINLVASDGINLDSGSSDDIILTTTGTTGTINLSSSDDFQITGTGSGSGNSAITATAQNLVISTSGSSSTLDLTSSEVLNLNSGGTSDINLTSSDGIVMSGDGVSSWTIAGNSLTLTTTGSGDISINAIDSVNLSGEVFFRNAGGTAYWEIITNEIKGITTSGTRYISSYDGSDLYVRGTGSSGDLRLQTTGTGHVYITSGGGDVFADSVNVGDHDHDGTSAGGVKISESSDLILTTGLINIPVSAGITWNTVGDAEIVSSQIGGGTMFAYETSFWVVTNFRGDFGYSSDTDVSYAIWNFWLPFDYKTPPSGNAFTLHFRVFQQNSSARYTSIQIIRNADNVGRDNFNDVHNVTSNLWKDKASGFSDTVWHDINFNMSYSEASSFGMTPGSRLTLALTFDNKGAGHDMSILLMVLKYSRGAGV